MRILITGANGFLARNVVRHFSNGEHQLIGLVRNDIKEKGSFIRIYNSVNELAEAEKSFDLIFHLAAYIPYAGMNQPDPALITANVDLTSRLVQLYDRSKFIYASSVAVYGDPAALPLALQSPFNNPTLYGLSKLAGEACVRNHPDHCIVRFSSIIGRGMKPTSFIPKIIQTSKTGKIPVYGNGARLQNYIDIEDAAFICRQVADVDAAGVILGVAEKSHSNLDVAKVIAKLTGSSIEFTGNDNSPSFVYDARDTFDRIRYKPMISLEESIKKIIA